MSDKNTTPKPPKYKKTIDATGLGLSCVTEYGFDDRGCSTTHTRTTTRTGRSSSK